MEMCFIFGGGLFFDWTQYYVFFVCLIFQLKDHVRFSFVTVGCKNKYVYIYGKNSCVDTQAQFSFARGVIGV